MAHALVEVRTEGKIEGKTAYSVPDATLEALRKLEGPVAVVSIAGIYRSGKSFLLNCLAQSVGESTQLFEVGPTIQACTRGLWIWPAAMTVPQPDGSSLRVLFVDSEGLGSVGGTQQHDLQVFSLAMLISSLFIYNSVGAIDESSISQLSFVTQLTKHIQVKSADDGSASGNVDELDKFFPDFIWALRDFTLNLVDEYGNPITEREYLENALSEEPGFSEEVYEKNRVRELVTAFFRRRDCCALMRPAEEEEELNALQTAATSGIRPGFLKQIDSLREKVLGMLTPKMVKGKAMTGPMLATMIASYAQAISSGATMTITDAWEAVTIMQVERAYEQSQATFQKALSQNPETGEAWQLPVATAALQSAYDSVSAAAIQSLERDMLEKDDAIVAKLRREMLAAYRNLCAENGAESTKHYSTVLETLWQPVRAQIDQPESIDGLGTVLLKWKSVKQDFKRQTAEIGLMDPLGAEALADKFLASTVLSDAVKVVEAQVSQYRAKSEEAAEGRSIAEAKLLSAIQDHMSASQEADFAKRKSEETLRARAEVAEAALQQVKRQRIEDGGEHDRELQELRMRAELASQQCEEKTACVSLLEKELVAIRGELLTSHEAEAKARQSVELSALELEAQKEMRECASETDAAKVEQLARALSLSRQSESTLISDVEALRLRLEELQVKLRATEEDRSTLQSRFAELEAVTENSVSASSSSSDMAHDAAKRVVQLESALELERTKAEGATREVAQLTSVVEKLTSEIGRLRATTKEGAGGNVETSGVVPAAPRRKKKGGLFSCAAKQ